MPVYDDGPGTTINQLQDALGNRLAKEARFRVWLETHAPTWEQPGEDPTDTVFRLLQWLVSVQSPLRTQDSSPEDWINPGWAPKVADDVPAFELELDAMLMNLASRETLNEIRSELLSLSDVKGQAYQGADGIDSCLKRAFGGLYHNLARKFDRITAVGARFGLDRENDIAAQEAAVEGWGKPETLYVTVRDMAVYCVHMMRWLRGATEHRGE